MRTGLLERLPVLPAHDNFEVTSIEAVAVWCQLDPHPGKRKIKSGKALLAMECQFYFKTNSLLDSGGVYDKKTHECQKG